MKLGDIVEIRFLDHVQNAKDPMEFKVWGAYISTTTNAPQAKHTIIAYT